MSGIGGGRASARRLAGAAAALALAAGWAFGAAGPAWAGEYEAWHAQIGVTASLQKGANDGRAVPIGILDTGVNGGHSELYWATLPSRSISLVGTPWNVDTVGHGTAVASVALGRRDGKGGVGVAPLAKIIGVKVGDPGSTVPTIAQGIRHAADQGAKVINLSFATNGWSPAMPVDAGLASALVHAASKSVLVFAAGNEGLSVPNWLAMHLLGPGVAGSGIIVGSADAAGNPSWFSNRPGDAALAGILARDSFLLAPGETMRLANAAGGFRTSSGTSFAAPAVSGAAALLFAKHPFLTPAQVVEILLRTAADTGAAGTDGQGGRGLLRVDRALSPVGVARVPTGATVAQASPVEASRLVAGSAAGTLPKVAEALAGGIVVDDYGRDFAADLSGALSAPAPRLGIRALLGAGPGRGRSIEMRGPGGFWFSSEEDAWSSVPGPNPGEASRRAARLTADPAAPEGRHWAMGGAIGGAGFSFGFGPGAVARMPEAPASASLFLSAEGGAAAQPILGLAEGGAFGHLLHALSDRWSVGVGFAEGERGALAGDLGAEARALALRARFQAAPGLAFEVTPTWLDERESALGSLSQGALDLGRGARTLGVGLGFSADLAGGFTLSGHFTEAVSSLEGARGSLFRDVSALRSRAMGASLAKGDLAVEGDRIGLSVDRPLRLSSGRATLDVPVGRAEDGTVAYDRRSVDLAPSGTETTVELSYARPLPLGAEGSLHLVHQEDAGHVRGARAEAVVARMRLAF
jgi:hypothetical protein